MHTDDMERAFQTLSKTLNHEGARNDDREDTKALLQSLSITTVTEALDIVERYIPVSLLTPKHRYFTESCLEP